MKKLIEKIKAKFSKKPLLVKPVVSDSFCSKCAWFGYWFNGRKCDEHDKRTDGWVSINKKPYVISKELYESENYH